MRVWVNLTYLVHMRATACLMHTLQNILTLRARLIGCRLELKLSRFPIIHRYHHRLSIQRDYRVVSESLLS